MAQVSKFLRVFWTTIWFESTLVMMTEHFPSSSWLRWWEPQSMIIYRVTIIINTLLLCVSRSEPSDLFHTPTGMSVKIVLNYFIVSVKKASLEKTLIKKMWCVFHLGLSLLSINVTKRILLRSGRLSLKSLFTYFSVFCFLFFTIVYFYCQWHNTILCRAYSVVWL